MTVAESSLTRFAKETRGGTDLLEYLILITVIALAGVAAFGPIRDAITGKASETAGRIGSEIK
jgi:Flp pilus assembly pilin Flp